MSGGLLEETVCLRFFYYDFEIWWEISQKIKYCLKNNLF